MKRQIIVTLVLSLIISMFLFQVSAMEISPMFVDIQTSQASFDISTSGLAEFETSCISRSGDKVVINTYLKKYTNGSWVTVSSWSDTDSGKYGFASDSYNVSSGHSYKTVNYCYVYKDGSLLDSTTINSITVYY